MKYLSVSLAALLSLVVTSIRAEDLPAPELTEQWQPVPPVVSAPAGQPPADAVVLFSGHDFSAWTPEVAGSAGWKIEDGAMVVVPKAGGLHTNAAFGDIQLHLEWRAPSVVKGNGQGRGNSGIFFMGLYELQVLDSYNNPTYVNGQAGSIYKQHPPLANVNRPPGEWQVYDAVFVAPRFSPDGKLLSPARVTAFLNGVLVQYNVELRGPTEYRGQPVYKPHAAKLPLSLQDHGDLVAYRNIWVRELSLPAANR